MITGGGLRVAHQGQEIIYDWSNTNPSTIEWAAFYSNCEHEVLPVTDGHRVTLTYNLFVSEPTSGVMGPLATADPARYPAYAQVRAFLADRSKMEKGVPRPFRTHRWRRLRPLMVLRRHRGHLLRAQLCPHDRRS